MLVGNIEICKQCEHCIDGKCKFDQHPIESHAKYGACGIGKLTKNYSLPQLPSNSSSSSQQIKQEEKPLLPTPKQVKTAMQAILTGEKVSQEIVDERVETCKKCDKVRQTKENVLWCRVCGCSTANDLTKVLNIAAYKEHPKGLWGCHHPQRKQGKGWIR